MKRRIFCTLLILMLLTSCGKETSRDDHSGGVPSDSGPTWQEQYDLGVRYLSEGNYQEAVIAFTAAIEIDPKRAEAFSGRGLAYVFSGETEENLTAAQTDFETAVELDKTLAEAWLGLADVYIRRGEYDRALEILREALEKTGGDPSVADKIAEMETGSYVDSLGNVRRSNYYSTDGILESYTEYYYDEFGRRTGWGNYHYIGANGDIPASAQLYNYCEVSFDEQNRPERNQFYEADGTPSEYDTLVYNEAGQRTEQHRYGADGAEIVYFLYYYNERGLQSKYEGYYPDGEMYMYWISEYDENGVRIRETAYRPDGTISGYQLYE